MIKPLNHKRWSDFISTKNTDPPPPPLLPPPPSNLTTTTTTSIHGNSAILHTSSTNRPHTSPTQRNPRRQRKRLQTKEKENTRTSQSLHKSKTSIEQTYNKWIKNKKKEQRIERKAKQREQELRTFRKKQNNLKKEKRYAAIRATIEQKKTKEEQTYAMQLKTTLKFEKAKNKDWRQLLQEDNNKIKRKALEVKLKQAKMDEWLAKKALLSATNARKMEEEKLAMSEKSKARRMNKWKMKY